MNRQTSRDIETTRLIKEKNKISKFIFLLNEIKKPTNQIDVWAYKVKINVCFKVRIASKKLKETLKMMFLFFNSNKSHGLEGMYQIPF